MPQPIQPDQFPRLIDRICDEIRDALTRVLMEEAGPVNGNGTGNGHGFTARERQVWRLLAQDRTPKEIAAALGLSPSTIYVHLSAIKAKVGLYDLKRLTRAAVEETNHLG